MPAKFERCVKDGGRVRTISHGKKYFHLCYPKGGGDPIKGETHTKKDESLKKARGG